jgi:fluoride exporter
MGDATHPLPGYPPSRVPRHTTSTRRIRTTSIASPRNTQKNVSDPGIDIPELLAIACGGALGAIARIGVAQAFPPTPGYWPWATFAVNITGALLLGYFLTRLQERLPVSTLRRPLLATGLCGALTTFSTVQIELLKMADHDRYGLAGGYLFASIIGGYLAVFVSSALVRRVRAIA